ncbi:ABC transporter permease [Demequina pelophila]|uniref:ABC transporter permease n=1 Tax=Demequina pelophila TaxID=1638984 RepID=UPI000784AC49|nr:ABC transporter permease [Demequina pelophila]
MVRLILRRLAWSVPLLVVATMLAFLIVDLIPGDPARVILGPTATAEQVEALRVSLGLDRPWFVQYLAWLGDALRGDLGTSVISKTPVIDQLNARLPATLSIVVGATVVSAVLGVALGVFSAVRGGWAGRAADVFAMLGFAIPNYWLGLVLVAVVAVQLRWLPATGYTPLTESPWEWLKALILPVITLAVGGVTMIAKNTREALRDVLARDFIDSLRADGWSESRILVRHALRNAGIPIVTAIGVFFVGVLGGTVLVESVFAIPGLGGLAVAATPAHDLPVLLGVTVYFCTLVVIVNLLVDVTYGVLNPKVRAA